MRWRGAELRWVVGLVLAFAAMWAVMAPLGAFAVNDDWAYSYAVRSILERGRFELTGFSAPNLYLQAWWGVLFCLPFGYSHQALQVSGLVAAAAGLVGAFALLRELGAPRGVAAVAAMTLGANPLYLVNAGSFMTDAPFAGMCAWSLYFYMRAGNAQRERGAPEGVPWAAYGLAFAALFIRQFALALPLAFAAGTLLRRRSLRALIEVGVPVVVFVAAHMLFQRWTVATGRAPQFAESLSELSGEGVRARLWALRYFVELMVPYVGAFVLPFLVPLLLRRRPAGQDRIPDLVALAAGLAIGAVAVWRGFTLGLMENGLDAFGLGPITLPDYFGLQRNRPDATLVPAIWTLLTVLGCIATCFTLLAAARAAGRIVARLRGRGLAQACWPEATAIVFAASYIGAVLAAGTLATVFDRYLISLIVPLCALLWRDRADGVWAPRARGLWWVGAAPVLACAVFAVVAGHDYFSFQRVRWAALEQLERTGVGVAEIDGGYEYNSRMYRHDYARDMHKSWWWVVDNRYMITVGPLAGYAAQSSYKVPRWMPDSPMTLFVLRREKDPPQS